MIEYQKLLPFFIPKAIHILGAEKPEEFESFLEIKGWNPDSYPTVFLIVPNLYYF